MSHLDILSLWFFLFIIHNWILGRSLLGSRNVWELIPSELLIDLLLLSLLYLDLKHLCFLLLFLESHFFLIALHLKVFSLVSCLSSLDFVDHCIEGIDSESLICILRDLGEDAVQASCLVSVQVNADQLVWSWLRWSAEQAFASPLRLDAGRSAERSIVVRVILGRCLLDWLCWGFYLLQIGIFLLDFGCFCSDSGNWLRTFYWLLGYRRCSLFYNWLSRCLSDNWLAIQIWCGYWFLRSRLSCLFRGCRS